MQTPPFACEHSKAARCWEAWQDLFGELNFVVKIAVIAHDAPAQIELT
jgi:hypothetical protein